MSQPVPLPPAPLKMEDLRVERFIDPQSDQVVSRYVNKHSGQPVGLAETYHLQPQLEEPPTS